MELPIHFQTLTVQPLSLGMDKKFQPILYWTLLWLPIHAGIEVKVALDIIVCHVSTILFQRKMSYYMEA